jgi:hypothetical protein
MPSAPPRQPPPALANDLLLHERRHHLGDVGQHLDECIAIIDGIGSFGCGLGVHLFDVRAHNSWLKGTASSSSDADVAPVSASHKMVLANALEGRDVPTS